MKKKITLFIDALINGILGILLLFFSPKLAQILGVPHSSSGFYPNILGGVFVGITLALIFEAMRTKEGEYVGLGLVGAVCINICGGVVLILWLIFGDLNLPVRGSIFLWLLATLLVVISSIELYFNVKSEFK